MDKFAVNLEDLEFEEDALEDDEEEDTNSTNESISPSNQ